MTSIAILTCTSLFCNRSRAGSCLARLATQSCEELLRDPALQQNDCVDEAIVGLVELGGVCEASIECAGKDLACYSQSGDEPRTCTPLSQPGESCDFIGCASGGYCIETGVQAGGLPTYTCVAREPAGVGEPL